MQATASVYTRSNAVYSKLTFKESKGAVKRLIPDNLPADYSGTFYVRLWEQGKRVWKPYRSLDEAMVAQANFATNQDRARKGIPLLPTPTVELNPSTSGSVAEAAATYLKEQESRVQGWRDGSKGGLSPNTYTAVKKSIQVFVDACTDFGAVNIAEFKTPERGRAIMLHVKKWIAAKTERRKGKAAYADGLKFTYISQLLAHNGIKMARDKKVHWNGDPGLLKWHEVPRAQRPKVSDVVYYTPADLKAMWNGAGKVIPAKNGAARTSWTSDDIRDLLEVLVLTGMRDEEVQHLQWDDIIWANGDGLPKFKVKDKPQYDWKPKNGERTVRPVEHFAVALRETLKARKTRMKVTNDRTLVFHTTVNTPDQNFADQIRKMLDNALTAKYEFNRPEAHEQNIVHNFRRTFATVLNSCYGLSAPTVQDRIGDADLVTVQRYLGKVDDPAAMRKAFEALPFGPKGRAKTRK
ncbi:MAG TPA: site-specific integrase [Candidatus Acidoferrales bacterium]|jgi:integrase|nr:site-specific integrase [Candidatus Acidoferrales bacterium]